MMPAIKTPLALAPAIALLAGCGDPASNNGPGGVTAEESQMLDEAAEILDERQADLQSPRPATATPEDNGTGQ